MADVSVQADAFDRQAVLAAVQRGLFSDAEDPARIGRFVVLDRLGTGASGVVYAAYDPQLDRKVALKLLRSDADLPPEAHSRLLREAQALARLSHPHIVAVHDVGDVDGRVFIAMELLTGGTLRRWSDAASEPRSVDDVLATYVQAGEGLAAAHAAGLVHRDFKPDNVLLDRRGRVRVVDFGLAREDGEAGRSMTDLVVSDEIDRLELDEHLTQTGALMGTPAYMAPEQFAGLPADARTDQYSFCVALYEALYGERPFRGETIPELLRTTTRGEVGAAPTGRAVPQRVRKALIRGLRPAPADRHPDMGALLIALRHDPLARWRRRGLVAVGLAALVGATWTAAGRDPTPAVACSGFERRLEGVWDEPRRATLSRHFVDQEPSTGAEMWARVEPGLSEYADAWVHARREACEATEVLQTQSDELLDRRVLCLDRAFLPLRAAVERLAEADAATIATATELIPNRAAVDQCSARGVLDDGDPPPADSKLRDRIASLEERIAKSESLLLAGKYPEGLALAQSTSEEAALLGHPPTHARAMLVLGTALSYRRKPDEAIDVLTRAMAEAELGRADRTRARIARWLVRRLGDTGHFEEARRLATQTDALTRRLIDPPPGAKAKMQMLWGRVEWTQGNYEAAIEHFDATVAATEGNPDPAIRAVYIEALTNRSMIAQDVGHAEQSVEDLPRAIEMRIAQDGPGHPQLAVVYNSLGSAEHRLGHYEKARKWLELALEIRERRLGRDHDSLAPTLANLGAVLIAQGHTEQGLAMQERSIALMARSLGPESSDLAVPLHNIALVYLRAGKPEQAEVAVNRAFEIRRAELGPHHTRTFDSRYQIAYVMGRSGHHARAQTAYEQLVDLLLEHKPDDHIRIVEALVGVADMALEQDDAVAAQRAMEDATQRLDHIPEQTQLHLAVDFNHALAIFERGREPARAHQLARRALGHARALPHARAAREQIETWLADHPLAD